VKPRPAAVLLAITCTAWSGCATSAPPAPQHYPKLPSKAGADGPAFAPDAALTPLALTCNAAEPTLANALDDDCDGKLDGQPGEQLALAYPRASQLALALIDAGGTEHALAPATCDQPASFCAARVALAEVAPGTYALTAKRADGATAEASSVLVSVQSQGKVTAYLASLAADQPERVLGQLTVP
jgi:hypothetical protein